MTVIHWTPVETIGKDRIRNCVIAKCGAGVWNDRERQTTDITKVTCKCCMKTKHYRYEMTGEPSKKVMSMRWNSRGHLVPTTIDNPKWKEWKEKQDV